MWRSGWGQKKDQRRRERDAERMRKARQEAAVLRKWWALKKILSGKEITSQRVITGKMRTALTFMLKATAVKKAARVREVKCSNLSVTLFGGIDALVSCLIQLWIAMMARAKKTAEKVSLGLLWMWPMKRG